MTELNSSQKEFCTYAGLFGILIGVVCFIQHFFVWKPDPYAFFLEITSVIGVTASVYLMLQKKETGTLMIISTSLLLARQLLFMILSLMHVLVLFNLLQVLYFIYMLIITIVFYISGYAPLLKKISEEKDKDDTFWNNTLN